MASGTVTDRASPPRRRFTLLDGMVLVAATAVGYALVHVIERWNGEGDFLSAFGAAWAERRFVEMGLIVYLMGTPVLAAWTVALVPLGLIGPRPRFRRLSRQPGLMAGIAVVEALGFVGLVGGVSRAIIPWIGQIPPEAIFLLPAVFGLAVVVAWSSLIVGRRWRAQASWIDRLGRVLGISWVLLGLASPFCVMLL